MHVTAMCGPALPVISAAVTRVQRHWKAFGAHISQDIMENMMDEMAIN